MEHHGSRPQARRSHDADGADILDVGGESTRPGHTPVSAEEEAARVVPVIEALRKHFDVPISVDTYKGSVADVAVQAGADLVNDVWGLKYDPEMAGVIAKHDAACCLMHNKANTEYNNFLIDMLAETQECVNIARKAGIKDERIISTGCRLWQNLRDEPGDHEPSGTFPAP